MIEDKLLEESLDERTLIEEVNWLYSRLTKKEMTILLKWVSANCDTAVQKALDKVVKLIDEFMERIMKETRSQLNDKDIEHNFYYGYEDDTPKKAFIRGKYMIEKLIAKDLKQKIEGEK